MAQLGQMKNWLGGRHIKVPDDWLEACLEWLLEENQGAPLPDSQLRSMVYEQWLAADLHELQTSCLPTHLSQQSKSFLQGVYSVQVDSLMDVSQPYYGQLQKVCGTENANVHVTATQATQPAWEMKSGRMLMLKITDGTTNVQGIEYKPIPCLKTSLLPGCKVRLKGRILCRQGVLFLKAENVEILGGEVDALLEINTQDKLLKTALSSIDNNTGGDLRREFTGSTPVGDNQGRQLINHGQTIPSSYQQQMTAQKSASNVSTSKRNISATVNEMEDDDFLESLATSELEALEQEWDVEMEDTSTQVPRSTSLNSGSSSTRSHVSQLPACPRKPSAPAALIGQSKQTERSQPITTQTSSSLSRPSQLGRPAQLGKPSRQMHSVLSGVNPGQRPEVTGSQRSNSQVDKIAEIEMEMEDLANLMNDDFPLEEDDDFEDCFRPTSTKKSKSAAYQPTATSSNCSNSSTLTGRSEHSPGQLSTGHCNNSVLSTSTSISKGHRSSSSTEQRLSSSTEQRTLRTISTAVVRQHSENTVSVMKSSPNIVPSDFSSFSNPDDFINHLKSWNRNVQISTGVPDTEPFTYISRVMSQIRQKRQITFKVKAYVATLLGKLDSGQGLGWTLTCRLNDGTQTLDVDLTDQVLTELIGFSAKDSIEIKSGMKGDKSVLTEGIKDCQLKLINVSCIFTVESGPVYSRPRVTAITPITRAHIEQLYVRVSNSGTNR